MTNMPKVNIENINADTLTDEEREIFNIIIKKDNSVRASKPKVKDALTGRASYVWRMVCFQVSPKPAHQCMPVCANFDLKDEDWENRREVEKELEKLIDIIVNGIDKSEWHGIKRWGRALGY